VNAAIERGVNAQVTTDLHAGVGAGDVPKSGTIERADLHILDRLGLDREISSLRAADGHQASRCA
jgi:hypothetical protein